MLFPPALENGFIEFWLTEDTNSNAWLSGVVLTSVIFQIPQRYVLVNHLSILDAGLRLLPFTAVMALSSVLVAALMNKMAVPAVYTLLTGGVFQIIGVAGLSQASTRPKINPTQYGFEVFAGVGVGIFNVVLILLAPGIVQKQHLGTVTHFFTRWISCMELADTDISCWQWSYKSVQNLGWFPWVVHCHRCHKPVTASRPRRCCRLD